MARRSFPRVPFAVLATVAFGCGSSGGSGAPPPDGGGGAEAVEEPSSDGGMGPVEAGKDGGDSGSTGDGGDAAAPPPVPTDHSGVTAARIADLMQLFGANVYSNGQDKASGDTVAGITSVAQYLLAGSDLTMIFRGYVDDAGEYDTFGPSVFAATGCKFTLCMGIGDTPDPSGVITLAQGAAANGNWVKFVEGGNEPNTNFGTGVQTGVTPASELAAQQQIYAAVHPLGIPVAAPSVVGSYQGIATYWGSDLSAAAAATDLYNTHLYPNNGGPNGANQLHDWTVAVSQSDWGGKGGIITEWQPVLFQNGHPTDDTTCAYWTPIMLLSGFVDFHVQAIVWWELFDYPMFSPHPGLFATSVSDPYPAAQVMHAMYALTGDHGGAKYTFTPGKLDVTVTGLPSGDNQYGGGRYAVFQNSSPGTFFVFVWNEQDALATATTTPVTVTFNEGPMTKVVDYSLTNPASASPTPKQTLSHVTQVKLDLTTEVRLLQVTHP